MNASVNCPALSRTSEEPEIRSAITQIYQKIADLLGGPGTVRVRGHAEDVHVAGADLDHEEAVQALEGHRAVDVEEIGSEHRRGLRAQEPPPGRAGAPLGRRGDLQRFEDPADRGCADSVAELEQLALDPLVPPAVVLSGETLDEWLIWPVRRSQHLQRVLKRYRLVTRFLHVPDAGPHVRWCGRGRGDPAPSLIMHQCCDVMPGAGHAALSRLSARDRRHWPAG